MPYCTQSDLEQRIGLNRLAELTNDVWQVSAPGSPSATMRSGGSLSGTYYWVISAISEKGETVCSTEVTGTTGGGNNTSRLAWSAVSGAKAYKIFRSTVSGTYTTPSLLVQTTALTYDDDGTLTLASGAPYTDSYLPNAGVITALILRADTKIDSLAGQVYTVPFTTVPDLIKTISVDLSCYYAFQRRPYNAEVPKEWVTAYDDAMKQLEAISNMLLRLPDTATIASGEANVVTPTDMPIVDFFDPENPMSEF